MSTATRPLVDAEDRVVNKIQSRFPGAGILLGRLVHRLGQCGKRVSSRKLCKYNGQDISLMDVDRSWGLEGLLSDKLFRLVSPKSHFLFMAFLEDSQVTYKQFLCFTLPLRVSYKPLTCIFISFF